MTPCTKIIYCRDKIFRLPGCKIVQPIIALRLDAIFVHLNNAASTRNKLIFILIQFNKTDMKILFLNVAL